jgi:hypothetical protein
MIDEERKQKILEIMKEKWLFSDTFNYLDLYFSDLKSFNSRTKNIAEMLISDLKKDFQLEYKLKMVFDFNLPFNKNEINSIDEKYLETVLDKAHKIKQLIQSKFPNLTIDDELFSKFVKSQEQFNSEEIIYYLIDNYGVEEDLISLTQIQQTVRKSLPYIGEERISNTDDLILIGKNGLRFETWHHSNVKAISQFAEIVIGKEYPSYAKGWEIPVLGNSYEGNACFKSMHFYKTGNVTILFHDPEDLKKFSECIFKTTNEIMEMIK